MHLIIYFAITFHFHSNGKCSGFIRSAVLENGIPAFFFSHTVYELVWTRRFEEIELHRLPVGEVTIDELNSVIKPDRQDTLTKILIRRFR